MKKRMTRLLLVILAAALLVTMAGCGAADNSEQVAQLQQSVEELTAQVEALTARVESLEKAGGLKDWSLSVQPWSSSNGATVTLSAQPENYQAGQTALFSIRLNDVEVANVVCAWDGTSYTASAELEAADGYSYFCTLVGTDGTREQIALNTVENPADETLVYLQSSMNAYSNVVVETWEATDTAMTITSGYVQVQLPRLGAGQGVSMMKAELVFELNAEELERVKLDLPEGEGVGSYEMALSDIRFKMPELEDDYQLDLWLEVALSSEETLVTSAGSWYYNAGELNMLVG